MNRLAACTLVLASVFAGAAAEAQVPVIRRSPPLSLLRPTAPSIGVRAPGTAPAREASQPARPGQLRCAVDENGIAAAASIEVRQAGRVVASGSCASVLSLQPGAYVAILTLEGVLDRPTRQVALQIHEGADSVARASFATAILEVRFTDGGAPAAGLAVVRRDGVTVGTLGSGVTARVSAGTYEVLVRYRTQERALMVTLAPSQRRMLRADF